LVIDSENSVTPSDYRVELLSLVLPRVLEIVFTTLARFGIIIRLPTYWPRRREA